MADTLDNDLADVLLNRVEYKGWDIKLTGDQLNRNLYKNKVDDLFQRLGGKWSGKHHVHVFPYDPKPLVEAVLQTGVLPDKNPTAFFPTPKEVVEDLLINLGGMVYADNIVGYSILEPSAGQGGIADVLNSYLVLAIEQGRLDAPTWIDLVEMLPTNATVLRRKIEQEYVQHPLVTWRVFEQDFLTWQPEPDRTYDIVVSNPPFAVEGDPVAYVTHTQRAFDFLVSGGRLLSIAPIGMTLKNTSKKVAEFRELVTKHGYYTINPDKAFAASGTNIRTVNYYIEKPWPQVERKLPHPPPNGEDYNGWPNKRTWHVHLYATGNNHQVFLAFEEGLEALAKQLDKLVTRDLFGPVYSDEFKEAVKQLYKVAHDSWVEQEEDLPLIEAEWEVMYDHAYRDASACFEMAVK